MHVAFEGNSASAFTAWEKNHWNFAFTISMITEIPVVKAL
jgi:hypothetical protein